jgi:hypothetical protein
LLWTQHSCSGSAEDCLGQTRALASTAYANNLVRDKIG